MLCIRGALLLLLFSTVLSTPAHAAKAPIPSFQVTVAASPADVQVKKTETLTATATSNINASDYNILFTVTLNGTQVASHSFTDFDFTADEPVTQTFDWTVPAKAASGAYVVTVEVKKDGDSYGSGTAGFTVGAAAAACGSTPSGSTETETLGTTFGSIAATAAQCPYGGTQPTTTTVTQVELCTNGTLADQGSQVSTTVDNGNPTCNAPAACGSTSSGSTVTETVSTISGSIAATTAQCAYGGTQPTTTTVTQVELCTNGTLADQGSSVSTTVDNGNPACNAAPVNGACSTSNGADLTSAPSANLCTSGTASAISGSGPWDWTCAGSNGGTTASCSAQLEINASCGASNGTDVTSAPSTGLCTVGMASSVSGSGPFDWSCAGSNGGTTASCSAQLKTNGACGASNGTDVTSAPTAGLCTVGTASSVSGSGPWTWSCNGSNGGSNASCSAPTAAPLSFTVNSVTTSPTTVAAGQPITFTTSVTANQSVSNYIILIQVFTSSSYVSTVQSYTGLAFTAGQPIAETAVWSIPSSTAAGSYYVQTSVFDSNYNYQTGATASFTIAAVNGACGSANGVAAGMAPSANLCSAGTASTLTGTGPWDWTCAGAGDGTTASCSAPATFASGQCGSMNGAFTNTAPTTELCNAGTASAVSGNGPWSWSCGSANGGTTALCEANTVSSGVLPFTALHTYHISPTGSDSNSGTSPSEPWATPNHSVDCGDVIIAAPGNYTGTYSPFGTNSWGAVSNCPSTSGGIDGAGGIYFATLLCGGSDLGSCTVSGTSQEAFRVDASNWAVEGFSATDANAACFSTTSEVGGQVIHHVAFINDIGSTCQYGAFGSYGWATAPSGVDQQAVVGGIAYDAANGPGVCGSGTSLIPTNGPDTSSGTHVYIAGAFSYDNFNGFCGNRSDGSGSYTTTTAAAAPGATSIEVAAITNWVVGLPIGDLGSSSYNNATPAIPYGTYITSISGSGPYTIGLSQPVASPGVADGDNIAAMTTTDGEGIIFDTWYAYLYQGVVEQSMLWGNGSAGYEMFCNGTCQSSLNIDIFNNTMYGNVQDVKHQNSGADFLVNEGPNNFHAANNLVQSSVTQAPGSVYNYAAGTGWPVNAASLGQTGLAIDNNFFIAAPGASCPEWATCDAGDSIAYYNGVNYDTGNFIDSSPGFKNPGALLTTAPNCSSQANTTECMIAAGVIDGMTPTGSAAGFGYQPPAPCAGDAYFPTWLKGVVYLSWNGSSITENPGLITKPCGM